MENYLKMEEMKLLSPHYTVQFVVNLRQLFGMDATVASHKGVTCPSREPSAQ